MTTERRGPSGAPGRTPRGLGADGSRALLRNRDFQALWTSRFLAGLGKESGEVAYPLLVLLLVESAAQAGAIGAAQVTAAMVSALLGGALADRISRRAVLLSCDLGRLALLALFTGLLLTGRASIPLIACVAVASAAMTGIANPVATAATKQLVPAAQLADAAAQNQIRLFGTTALGAPVAGSLFNLGRALPFAVEAVTYLASAVLLLAVRRPMQADRADAGGRTLRGMADGFAVLVRHPLLRPMIAWILGFNLAFTATGAFLAIIATAEGQGASHLQIGMTVSLAGTGGLVGSLAAGTVVRWARPSATFRMAAWSAPVGALALLAAPNVVLLGVVVGCVFAIVPSANALFYGYVAASVGDARQGRVLGAVMFLAMLSQPVGILGVGLVFDHAGPEWVFLTMALVSGAAALCTLTPVMRSLPRPEDVSVA
ncbi:MFS transporter [Nocardiopsis sp. FIRDI 009]|uniref:MFS transporter n=1 Tax=Nocardiopsis sp. FIRDI 009 TaxID=714197 RepID=UPI000E26FCE8|nr:MFS transporter [Nocardiopsis sp. FIRDI 009]